MQKQFPTMPNVVYATKNNTFDPQKEGVIIYTRTAEDNDVLAWLDTNNKIITQSQLTILKAAECNKSTAPQYTLTKHHEMVKAAGDVISREELLSVVRWERKPESNTGSICGWTGI